MRKNDFILLFLTLKNKAKCMVEIYLVLKVYLQSESD